MCLAEMQVDGNLFRSSATSSIFLISYEHHIEGTSHDGHAWATRVDVGDVSLEVVCGFSRTASQRTLRSPSILFQYPNSYLAPSKLLLVVEASLIKISLFFAKHSWVTNLFLSVYSLVLLLSMLRPVLPNSKIHVWYSHSPLSEVSMLVSNLMHRILQWLCGRKVRYSILHVSRTGTMIMGEGWGPNLRMVCNLLGYKRR